MTINWTNITTVIQILNIPNENTNGLFWLFNILMIWFVLNLLFIRWGMTSALLSSSMISFVISLFLVYMGVLAWWVALAFFSLTAVLILYLAYKSNKFE